MPPVSLCLSIVLVDAFVPVGTSSRSTSRNPTTRSRSTCSSFHRRQRLPSGVHIHLSDYSKWDNLIDEDDNDDLSDVESSGRQLYADMKYVLPNIQRQAKTFDAIDGMGDLALLSDVWLQAPGSDSAWFVGRVARVSDVSIERAIDRQFQMIERHAWTIRPVDLHPSRGPFFVYYSPGKKEELVLAKDENVSLVRVDEKAVRASGSGETVKTIEVGFRGASYDSAQPDAYRVQLSSWESEEVDEMEIELMKDFATSSSEKGAADSLDFFDDDFSSFMEKAFPKQ